MKLILATIVQGTGPDHVSIQTDLPSPCPNFDSHELCLDFQVEANGGPDYVAKHFPGVPIRFIGRPKPLYQFSKPSRSSQPDELIGRAVKSYKGLRP
jgi:hypothetical protein